MADPHYRDGGGSDLRIGLCNGIQLGILNCAGGCDEHRPLPRAPLNVAAMEKRAFSLSPGLCEVPLMGDVVEFRFNV
jgi:hypothetical protein